MLRVKENYERICINVRSSKYKGLDFARSLGIPVTKKYPCVIWTLSLTSQFYLRAAREPLTQRKYLLPVFQKSIPIIYILNYSTNSGKMLLTL